MAADTSLNITYQKAIKSAADRGARDLANLRDAQRKWVAYRESDCFAAYSLFGSGSGGPVEKLGCLLKLTNLRIEDLKYMYILEPR